MSNFAVCSWILGAVSIAGFLLIGRRVWWAWFINIVAQIAWIVFWSTSGDPRPIVTSVVYIVVFAQNAFKWSKEYHSKTDERKPVGSFLDSGAKGR